MENKFSYEAKMKYCIYYLLILKSLFFIKKISKLLRWPTTAVLTHGSRPLWGLKILSQGMPKNRESIRYLHYAS